MFTLVSLHHLYASESYIVLLIDAYYSRCMAKVREVQEAVARSSRPDVEVILSGTTFLTPDDMRELLFGDYSHI